MNTDERIREALREHAEHPGTSLPPIEDVFAHARRQTMKSGLAMVVAVVIVGVAAVASISQLRSPTVEFFDGAGPGQEEATESVPVPDVQGWPLSEAQDALQAVGLSGGPASGPGWSDPTAPEAVVVAQKPPAGTEVAPGEVVGFRTAVVTRELCDAFAHLPPRRGDARDLARTDGYWEMLRQAKPLAQPPLADYIDALLAHIQDTGSSPMGNLPGRALDSVAIHHDACSTHAADPVPNATGSDVAADVVADQATLPEMEVAEEHIGVATTIGQRDAQWARFGLTGSAPSVDFADRILLFVGFGESGSCPYLFDGIEVDDQTLRLLDAQDQEVCTDDFNLRTVVLRIDREVLPDGFLTVDMPAGAADAVISLPASAEPPPATPNAVSTSTDVNLLVEPQSVPVGDNVTVQVANTTEQERVRAALWVRVDRWTGHHFEVVGEFDPGGDLVEVGPGETLELMTVSTADSVFAAGPGWFRVTAPQLTFVAGAHGRISDARGNLQVIQR